MVEGRISSSAVVGAGSDVGGGASILGFYQEQMEFLFLLEKIHY